jgi:putative SOS response-associated peptidase YedK
MGHAEGRTATANARAETLLERPMFKGAVAAHRWIIPADGFYEWREIPGQKAKQPMHIRLKGVGLYGFAGLYTWRRGSESGDWAGSCVIIRTAPNELLEPIHNRMPVILQPEDEAPWLDTSIDDAAAVLSLTKPYPARAYGGLSCLILSLVSTERWPRAD